MGLPTWLVFFNFHLPPFEIPPWRSLQISNFMYMIIVQQVGRKAFCIWQCIQQWWDEVNDKESCDVRKQLVAIAVVRGTSLFCLGLAHCSIASLICRWNALGDRGWSRTTKTLKVMPQNVFKNTKNWCPGGSRRFLGEVLGPLRPPGVHQRCPRAPPSRKSVENWLRDPPPGTQLGC